MELFENLADDVFTESRSRGKRTKLVSYNAKFCEKEVRIVQFFSHPGKTLLTHIHKAFHFWLMWFISRRWRSHHLYSSRLAIGLNIETSYLVLICYPAHRQSYRLHIAYVFLLDLHTHVFMKHFIFNLNYKENLRIDLLINRKK